MVARGPADLLAALLAACAAWQGEETEEVDDADGAPTPREKAYTDADLRRGLLCLVVHAERGGEVPSAHDVAHNVMGLPSMACAMCM